MSKSILVIDTPKTCLNCRFCRELHEGIEACCELSDNQEDDTLCEMIDCDYCQEKPKWCPLKEMPEKKMINLAKPVEKQWGYEFTNGYNYCIDQILKEVFENPIPYNGENVGRRY